MAPAREFGHRRFQTSANRQAQRSAGDGAPTKGFAAALAVVALVAAAWAVLPPPGQWTFSFFGTGNGLDFSGVRIGRSATAPALKLCMTNDVLNIHADTELDPAIMLQVLKASASQGRVTRVPGAPKEHAVLELAQMWGEVADCVYRQNAFRLCDIDNRTLAVESGSIFVRQADRIVAQPESTYAAQPGEIRALTATRDRVLDLMRNRVQSGVLIASDFPSSFAPPAVRTMLNDTATLRNECSKETQP